jgi:hypothetical protein
MTDGVFCRVTGACCESCRATAGGRCAGGWDSEEAILLISEVNNGVEMMCTVQS